MKDILEKNNLLKPPKVGEIVEGKVIGLGKSAVYIDLGVLGTGIIYGREFYQVKEDLKNLKIGDRLFLKIINLENEDGYIELSLAAAGKELSWSKLLQKKENDETIKVKILGANKGGLLVEVEGIRGFLPVSQLSFEHYPRVEGADKSKILNKLQSLVGKELEVKIFDLNPKEDKLIFSERATEVQKIKDILKNYKVGEVVEGEITSLVSFGAFLKFSLPAKDSEKKLERKLEGLIHISELDWKLIEDPAEVVKVGEKVKAKIIEVTDDGRIFLSLKALQENPWENIKKKYKKRDEVEGKVIKFNPFGAFVEIDSKIQGLIHISEFGSRAKMEEKLKIGQKYHFQILQIDPKEYRLLLKLKDID